MKRLGLNGALLTLLAGAAACSPTTALAQRPHPIDSAFAACTATYRQDPNWGGEPAPGRYCEAEAVRAWNAELARLVAKVPRERLPQAAWVARRDAHLDSLQAAYSSPGVGLTTTGMDEMRWYQIAATRRRVLQLTLLAKEQPFALPKE